MTHLSLRMLGLVALVFRFGVPAASSSTEQPSSSPNPVGRWVTGPDGGVIEIEPCGDAALCGRIVGITLDHPSDPEPKDVHGQPQCGLTIISGAVKTGPDEWTGHVTDPRDGKTYHARISVDGSGRLHMRGYVGLPVFGETVIWQPFEGRIADRCLVVGPTTEAERGTD